MTNVQYFSEAGFQNSVRGRLRDYAVTQLIGQNGQISKKQADAINDAFEFAETKSEKEVNPERESKIGKVLKGFIKGNYDEDKTKKANKYLQNNINAFAQDNTDFAKVFFNRLAQAKVLTSVPAKFISNITQHFTVNAFQSHFQTLQQVVAQTPEKKVEKEEAKTEKPAEETESKSFFQQILSWIGNTLFGWLSNLFNPQKAETKAA